MNFQVPQFIEEKPKIVGFLTLQQFSYLGIAGFIAFISYHAFTLAFAVLIWIFCVGIGVALAFGKINGQPIPIVLTWAFSFFWKPRVYTWQRQAKETLLDTSSIEKIESLRQRMSIQEKLKSIALSVTTGKAFSAAKPPAEKHRERSRYQMVTYLTGEKKVAKRVDY